MSADLVIVVAGRLFQIVTVMAILRLATERLPPDQYGTLDAILRITALLALVMINPVGMLINRRIHSWQERGLVRVRLRAGLIALVPVACLGGAAAYAVCAGLGLSWGATPAVIAALVASSLFLTTLNQTLVPGLNMLGRRVWWAILTLITLWTGLAMAWWLTASAAEAVRWQSGMLCGMAIGAALALAPFLAVAGPAAPAPGEAKLGRDHLSTAFWFTAPLAVVVALNWTQFQSFRLVMGDAVSLAFLGMFAAGYAVSQGVFAAFEGTAQQYFHPILYRRIEGSADARERDGHWVEYAAVMLPLTILTAVAVALLADVACWLLVAPEYRSQARWWAMLGSGIEAIRVIGNTYALAAHGSMRTPRLILPQAVPAVLVVVGLGSIPFVPWDPVAVVVASLVASSAVYAVLMHRMACVEMGGRMPARFWRMFFPAAAAAMGMMGIAAPFMSEGPVSAPTRTVLVCIVYAAFAGWLLRRLRDEAAAGDAGAT
jgi:hypothetical protein